MIVRAGVPSTGGGLWEAAVEAGAPILVSAGALWDKEGQRFKAPGLGVWWADVAIDSAGFVAMTHHGGYPWTVDQYVELVVMGRSLSKRPDKREPYLGGLHPWTWWSAMDYCCEPEIAGDREAVAERVRLTVERFGECFEAAEGWREQGVTNLPDPMPILQGWRPDDYCECADKLVAELARINTCRCPDEDCDAEWHREPGLPALVGIGSVCRRKVHGPDGVLAVLDAVDSVLPAGVQVHLFGVKGAALPLVSAHPRVFSTDSMAWDYGARRSAKGESNTVARRGALLAPWFQKQQAKLGGAQLRLFQTPRRTDP